MGKTVFFFPLMVLVLLPTSGATLSSNSPNITTDQVALLALKSNVSHDPRNLLATNWSTSTSVCNWIGVTCGSRHHRVIALNFSGMGLTGTIQPHLGNLSFLAWLDIRHNSFHGSLPIELANLQRLKYLNFANNSFSGEIPLWFGSFTNLQSLFLHANNFTGVVPSTLGNLSKLEMLNLNDNNLNGQIPTSVGNLSNLKYLHLASNQLSGEIPAVFENLTSLLFFDVSNNKLTGRIPALPPSLRCLSVADNNLVGEIPPSICSMSSLEGVGLFGNNLGGTIPECVGNLSSSVSSFLVEDNNFHGKIPENFTKGCLLESFSINNNQIEGSLPRSLGHCKGLKLLDVGNNNINDTFPIWLENLDHLQVLILRSNRFYGQVDKYFEVAVPSFSYLRIIDLSLNEFSGYLPTKFFENLYAIRKVYDKKVKPEYLIDLSADGLVRYVPKVAFATKGLKTDFQQLLNIWTAIDLSNNKFFGEIPKELGELHSLLVLNLSHNSLTGPIPSSLGDMSELESLDLSSNKLEGRIPAQLENLKFLEVLNLSYNYLVGPVPRGSQLDTFTNDSYNGNLGLCGFPLSANCSPEGKLKPTPRKHRSAAEFNWKCAMAMGYGCGVVFGLSMGYITFATGKPWWFIRMIERCQQKYVGGKIRKSGGRK